MSGAVYGEGIADYIAAVQARMTNDPPSVEPSRRRARFERYADLFKEPYPEGLQIRDYVHVASGREIPVRIYRPAGDRLLPTLVYMHGGGFVSGSIATHDSIVAQLAALAGIQVVSVHYRRAPENPFPAALEDTYEVLRWLGEDLPRTAGGYKPADCRGRQRGRESRDRRSNAFCHPRRAAAVFTAVALPGAARHRHRHSELPR